MFLDDGNEYHGFVLKKVTEDDVMDEMEKLPIKDPHFKK